MDYLLILVGFVLLVKGADYFVDGASSIAKSLRVPTLIIGLTIVAFGTSAPEAAVSITSALQGQNGIALGNVVGSNIFNLLVVVGVAAFIYPLKVKKTIVFKEFPFVLLSGVVLLALTLDQVLDGGAINVLGRIDGFILLAFFGIFMYYLVETAITSRGEVEEEIEVMPMGKSVLLSIGGVIGIIIGGQVVVDSASAIATTWGMSESLIGLTIIAVGTSLPELVTSIVAARKGESDIALGNVIGSNIFNIFLVLGMSTVINPIVVTPQVFTDIFVMLVVTVLTYIFAITRMKVNKMEGITLVVLYVSYMLFAIMRN